MPFKQRSDDDEAVSSVDICEEYLVKTAGDIFSETRCSVLHKFEMFVGQSSADTAWAVCI